MRATAPYGGRAFADAGPEQQVELLHQAVAAMSPNLPHVVEDDLHAASFHGIHLETLREEASTSVLAADASTCS